LLRTQTPQSPQSLGVFWHRYPPGADASTTQLSKVQLLPSLQLAPQTPQLGAALFRTHSPVQQIPSFAVPPGKSQTVLFGRLLSTHVPVSLQVYCWHAGGVPQSEAIQQTPSGWCCPSQHHPVAGSGAGPFAAGVCTHPVSVSQESVVQGLLSLQTIGVFTHPVCGSQLFVVQAFPSSQLISGFEHVPSALQMFDVQALLSSQFRPQTPQFGRTLSDTHVPLQQI